MDYENEFWDVFTKENETKLNFEFAKFIRDLAVSLRASNVLEVGCNIGNDLTAFSEDMDIHGIDLNENALTKAKEKHPTFNFKKGSITEIPYPDNSFDFVFTHDTMNYIDEQDMTKAITELFRVSKKYITNCERFSEAEEKLESEKTNCWNRNMLKHWMDFKVKIISNVDMHEEIEPDKVRFTLVRKI